MLFYIILLISLLILLLFLKIQIELKLIIRNGRNFSFVIIRFLGFIRLRMNLSMQINSKGFLSLTIRKTDSAMDMDKKASFEQLWDSIKDVFQYYGAHVEPFRYFKRKVKFNNFSVSSRIGTGDAATTAMTIGGCYAFFTTISRYLYRHYHLQKSKLDMQPYFSGPLFDLDLDCIMNFKFGHIIIAGLKLLTKKEKAVS